MTLEELIYQGANTASISNVSTRGQPIGYPAPCKTDIKKSIRSAINENPNFKQFLEGNHAYGRYIKNVTSDILRSRDPLKKLTDRIYKIAHSSYNNKELINSTICWSSTSEGSDYWFELYNDANKK